VVLSTAEPMLNAAPPELFALDVTVSGGRTGKQEQAMMKSYRENAQMGQQLRQQARLELNSNRGVQGWQFSNDAAALEQTNELLWPPTRKRTARRSRARGRASPTTSRPG
jgi:hypothetical protein